MLIVETVYYNVRMIHAILLKNNIVVHDLREHDQLTQRCSNLFNRKTKLCRY